MKILRLSSLLICFWFCLSSCNTQNYDYKVENYNLAIETINNTADVKVTMELTYIVGANESKSEGFKFVGDNTVDSLTCWDETGVISSKVDYLKETRISFQFNPIVAGTKKIKSTFILRDFIKTQNNKFVIDATWAGVFRVPVEKAKYSLYLPSSYKNLKFKEPHQWKQEIQGNFNYFYYTQVPLKEKTIKIKFEK